MSAKLQEAKRFKRNAALLLGAVASGIGFYLWYTNSTEHDSKSNSSSNDAFTASVAKEDAAVLAEMVGEEALSVDLVPALYADAVLFMSTTTAVKVPTDKQLVLYALFKQVNKGPCNIPKPGLFEITGRAKWDAWQKLGAMDTVSAMRGYIGLVTEIGGTAWYDFDTDIAAAKLAQQQADGTANSGGTLSLAPTMSRMAVEDDDEDADRKDNADIPETDFRTDVCYYAQKGDIAKLQQAVANGEEVDYQDSQGMTALHWAIEGTNLDMVIALLNLNADPNVADEAEDTPLHYACNAEEVDIVRKLVAAGANPLLLNTDGESCSDFATADIQTALTQAAPQQ